MTMYSQVGMDFFMLFLFLFLAGVANMNLTNQAIPTASNIVPQNLSYVQQQQTAELPPSNVNNSQQPQPQTNENFPSTSPTDTSAANIIDFSSSTSPIASNPNHQQINVFNTVPPTSIHSLNESFNIASAPVNHQSHPIQSKHHIFFFKFYLN